MSDVGSEHDEAEINGPVDGRENGREENNRPLDAGEIGRLRLVLENLEALEQTLHTLIRDQTSLTEAVVAFATRTERRQNQNMEQIKANQALLREVINQIQCFAVRSDQEVASQRSDLASLRAEMDSLQQTVQLHNQGLHGAGQSANSTNMAVSEDELYADWDVVGQIPPHAPNFTNSELENRVSTCLKQNETPTYSGANDDDIDVYVLNMISWYAAYGLYLGQDQVDWRARR
ncbi:unnamed protein product [Phytophthora fragariaefolia]|uniref:Unnamed protein product n=1 Tax=Phytophthora fragariaefolia TaxID=1490495 RepID=A0A9W6YM93_9STRA|nr:unnamed protein product [Phytophthora fragariaefolia]